MVPSTEFSTLHNESARVWPAKVKEVFRGQKSDRTSSENYICVDGIVLCVVCDKRVFRNGRKFSKSSIYTFFLCLSLIHVDKKYRWSSLLLLEFRVYGTFGSIKLVNLPGKKEREIISTNDIL